MGLDLNKVSADLNRLLTNLGAYVDQIFDLHMSNTSKTIDIKYIDAAGVEKTISVPNRAKLAADYLASVSSSMSKVVYVDQAAGDDAQPGTSAAPKKTIGAALSLAPYGSRCDVYLRGDYVMTEKVVINSQTVNIRAESSCKLSKNMTAGESMFDATFGCLYFGSGLTLEATGSPASMAALVAVNRGSTATFVPVAVSLADNTALVTSSGAGCSVRLSAIDFTLTAGARFLHLGAPVLLQVLTDVKIAGVAITAEGLRDRISGLVWGVEGSPRNLLCNINLPVPV